MPADSVSIRIYSGIARFPCDSMAFLFLQMVTFVSKIPTNEGNTTFQSFEVIRLRSVVHGDIENRSRSGRRKLLQIQSLPRPSVVKSVTVIMNFRLVKCAFMWFCVAGSDMWNREVVCWCGRRQTDDKPQFWGKAKQYAVDGIQRRKYVKFNLKIYFFFATPKIRTMSVIFY